MILELDIGNSRIKWRMLSADEGGALDQGFSLTLEEFFAEKENSRPNYFRLCNVRDSELTDQIASWSMAHWQLEPRVAKVVRECAGVTINYPDVSRLGVDRWLAMLAANKRNQNSRPGSGCLIVDSGTAFTLDAISTDGDHVGGYILPGLTLMHRSLTENTGIRLSDDAKLSSLDLGNSTDEAVLNGSLATLVALIEKQSALLSNEDIAPSVLFSGGDAELLQSLVSVESSEIVSSLVLDGLELACPETNG